ncbi:Clp protease N-terminal domain-containing protein [Streptomyces melanosporofaciens]|uniref:Clp amino terminal domain-containing protein, pathogenicity island component n=1 Tax=Streptomyces melanosporofaciens TaxID=67327 RepID=A0A1H4MYI0_STRMJ|nr:Clp protease N-terminal domain-containing protein [Streptomyces melanosporofaciens]SEB87834.1 Clp amino terminal domain-containing protein, pathogenicity island component [Streptomyces melanosporofaciens]
MFERFTTSARQVVRGAVRHAEDAGADTVGEAELLLALLDRTDGDRTGGSGTEDGGSHTEASGGRKDRTRTRGDRKGSPAAEVLAALGAHGRRASIERALAEVRRRGGITGADAEALAGLGIDVDEIVARVEEAHGVGALATAGPTPGATSESAPGSASARAPRRGRRPLRRPFSREAKSVLERSLRIALARGDKYIGDEHLLLALTARPGVAAHVLADHDVTYIQVERALTARAAKG